MGLLREEPEGEPVWLQAPPARCWWLSALTPQWNPTWGRNGMVHEPGERLQGSDHPVGMGGHG